MRDEAGSWLEGPAFARDRPRGARLGLPPEGPGSLASPGARIAAFVVDSVVANLLAGLPYLFGLHYRTGERGYAVYAAFLLQEFVLVSVAGSTIGKQLCRIRVTRIDGGRLAWQWVLARTILLGLLVPAVVWDRDGRGLHDRAAGAVTVRVGSAAPTPAGPVRPPQRPEAASGQQRPPKAAARRRKKRR
jgi:uncharacterized RDD family membrane protein YckC